MNEDGYGASDREQELNDLEDMARRIGNLAWLLFDENGGVDKKYGLNIVDRLRDMAVEVETKIMELREG